MGSFRRGTGIDPARDPAAADVLAAYEAAERAGRDAVQCYCAGVAAWRRAHPDQIPAYAARRAVGVMLAAKVSLRVVEDNRGDGRGPPLSPRERCTLPLDAGCRGTARD